MTALKKSHKAGKGARKGEGGKRKVRLEIQRVFDQPQVPDDAQLKRWTQAALRGRREAVELLIRIVDEDEITGLNRDYRGKDQPTNVLAFPFQAPPPVSSDLLGDLVICAPVVAAEARQQAKPLAAHWAHMVVHVSLHLLGYDHVDEAEAQCMERLEADILNELGYPDPYQDYSQ
jgi:probable rRNA maturation factor